MTSPLWQQFIDKLAERNVLFEQVKHASDRRDVVTAAGFTEPIDVALIETEWCARLKVSPDLQENTTSIPEGAPLTKMSLQRRLIKDIDVVMTWRMPTFPICSMLAIRKWMLLVSGVSGSGKTMYASRILPRMIRKYKTRMANAQTVTTLVPTDTMSNEINVLRQAQVACDLAEAGQAKERAWHNRATAAVVIVKKLLFTATHTTRFASGEEEHPEGIIFVVDEIGLCLDLAKAVISSLSVMREHIPFPVFFIFAGTSLDFVATTCASPSPRTSGTATIANCVMPSEVIIIEMRDVDSSFWRQVAQDMANRAPERKGLPDANEALLDIAGRTPIVRSLRGNARAGWLALAGRRGDAGTPPSLLRQASSLMSSNDLGAARRPIRSKHVQTETVDGIPALDVVLAGSSQQHQVDTSPLLDSIFPSPAPSGTLDPTAGGSVSVPLQRLASTSSNPLPTAQQQEAGQPPKSPSPLQLSSYDDPPQPSTSHSAFSSIFNTTEQKLIRHLLTELEEMLMPHDEKDAEKPPTPTPPEVLVLRRLSTWLFDGLAGTNSASSFTSKNEKDRPSDLQVSHINALRDSASSSTTSVKGAALMPDSTPLDGSSAFNRLRSIKSLSKIRRRLSEEGIPVVSEEGQDSESNSVADDGNETKPKHGDGDDVDGEEESTLKPHFSMPSKAPEPEMEMPSYMQKAGSVADIPSAFAAGRTTSYRSGSISGGHGSMLKKASTKQIPSSEGATSGAGDLKSQTPEPTTGTHPHTGTGGAASPMEQLMAQRRRRNKNPSSSSHHSRVVLPTLTRDEHHPADGDQSAVDGAELDNLRAMLQLMPSMVSGGGGHHNSSGVEGSYQHHQRHAHPLAQDGDVLDPADVGTSKQLMFSSECALPTPARSKSLKQL